MKVYSKKLCLPGKIQENIEISCIDEGSLGINITDHYNKSAWVTFNLKQAAQIQSAIAGVITKMKK